MTETATSTPSEASAISYSVFKVMLGGMLSLSAGLINQMIIAAFFGAGFEMDAYLTAQVIPFYIQTALLSGISFVFIPAFLKEENEGREDDAWGLVGTFFWLITGISLVVAVVGAVLSKEIISITAPGFSPEKTILAARMLTILMFTVPFTGLTSFTVGIQNARNRFFWPSVGGAANSVGNFLTIILFFRFIGSMSLAWGFLVAIIFQCSMTAVPILGHGWRKLIPLNDRRVPEMARLILPFLFFGLITRGTTIFERFFASGLPSGQISYLGYGYKISNIYVQLLATGIAAAIFPAMARAHMSFGSKGLAEKTEYGMRLTLAAALPAILITGAISVPLVHVLFQRGAFLPEDTISVASVVLFILVGDVLCRMVSNIIGRAFYVLKDTLTPPVISAVSFFLYLLIGKYLADRWGYIGLGWAFMIQQIFGILVLAVFMLRKLPGMTYLAMTKSALLFGGASTGAYFLSKFVVAQLQGIHPIIQLALAGLSGVGLYLAVLYLGDREILGSLLEMFGVGRILNYGLKIRANLEKRQLKKLDIP